VVTPFLARVRDRLGVHAQPAPEVRGRLGRILGSRVAAIRWGPAAGEEFLVQNDGDIRAAVPLFAKLPELLSGSAATR